MMRITAALLAAGVATLAGQSTPGRPVFEAASIKPNRSGEARSQGVAFQPGGRLIAENVALRELIAMAYSGATRLNTFQIVGGPQWATSDRFDVIPTLL